MKTIEEKAKAYDEAYKVAVELHNLCKEGTQTAFHRANLETMFPELAESEDERIRKGIFKALSKKDARDVLISQGIKVSDALAWLKKQGERKTPRWMIDFLDSYRRKIGCSLDHDEARDVEGKILCIMQWLENQNEQEKDILEDYILDGYFLDGNEDGLIAETIRYKHEKQGRQNHTQEIEPFEAEHGKYYYCIKDYFCGGRKQASKGDVIQALRGLPIMGLKDASEYFLPINSIKCNSAWGEEDEHRIKDTVYFLDTAKKHYASTEELDACIDWIQSIKDRVQLKQEWSEEDEIDKEILNAAILFAMNSTDEFACNGVSKEDVIDWLKSFKDRDQSQPKQEWSEEDSIRLQRIIDFLWYNRKGDTDTIYQQEQDIDWLKSLRPQNNWKPSKEQMDSITCAVKKMKESSCYDSELVSLLNDLKKLKKE